MLEVRFARHPQDTAEVVAIFREFAALPQHLSELPVHLTDFATLPGAYAPPSGGILIAEHNEAIVGCVAFRRVSDAICEMKRLYVRPSARGLGLGRKLVARLLEEATAAGYREIRLDVLAEFDRAQYLYHDMGFAPAEPVSHNPTPNSKYLGLKLR